MLDSPLSYIELDDDALHLVSMYWNTKNDHERWLYASAIFLGAGVMAADPSVALELMILSNIARKRGYPPGVLPNE